MSASPGRQHGHRVTGADSRQRSQQPCDAPRVVEADMGSGITGQQDLNRVTRTRRIQRVQQPGDVPRVG